MRVGISQYTQLQTRPNIFEVDPATVATDSFMTNVHLILLHFAEPFMDAQYTKVRHAGLYLTLTLRDWIPQIDRIDPHYYAHTSRINIKEETRINATSEEAVQWDNAHRLAPGQQYLPPFPWEVY